ncbi:MAG TPA: exodeoxyribonuclease III [Planctomycetota bacterium]|nr:exodeoxyribonuclease III [Planctomycetota bacterium]
MRLVTWNVNSIRTRLPRCLALLGRQKPDVLCLQETKVPDADFPVAAFEEVGYRAALHGQKTYNGVAILTRGPLERIQRGIPDGEPDDQARLLAATAEGVRVVDVYVPNGEAVDSPKFPYKLRWLERLAAWLRSSADPAEPLLVCGDFNVAPEDRDVHDPERWRGQVLFHPEEQKRLRALCAWGLVDLLRLRHPEPGIFTWWDYRMGAFHRGWGLRIDLLLGTRPLAERLLDLVVDREERKESSGEGKPSDHAPVVADFA